MNTKKLAMAALAVVIAVFLSNFLIHQVFLKNLYMSTAHLWRTEEEMKSFCGYMLLGQIIYGAALTVIFAHGYKGKGWKEGVRYGLLMGALGMGGQLIMFAVSPYPASLVWAWIVTGFAQSVLCGVVASYVYKPKRS